MQEPTQIPDKLYFRIGEVAKIIGVEPYVLRYWETEFPEITPVKSKSKQRLYKRTDVELIDQIRDLLYNQKFTIKGARHRIKKFKTDGQAVQKKQITLDLELQKPVGVAPQVSADIKNIVSEMRSFLNE